LEHDGDAGRSTRHDSRATAATPVDAKAKVFNNEVGDNACDHPGNGTNDQLRDNAGNRTNDPIGNTADV